MELQTYLPVRHLDSYKIDSKGDLLEAFRMKDRASVVLPTRLEFPLNIRHYYSWTESSGSYTYLLFKRPNWDLPRGIIFRRGAQATSLCDWCHSYGSGDEVGMLTIKVSPRRTVGMLLCADLSCLNKLEIQVGVTGKNFDVLAEQLCERISRFFERTILAPAEVTLLPDPV